MSSQTTVFPESRSTMTPGNGGDLHGQNQVDPSDLEHKLKDLEYRLKCLEQYHPKPGRPYGVFPEDPNAPPQGEQIGFLSVRDLVGPGQQTAQAGVETAVTFIVVDINPVTLAETPVAGATVDVVVPLGVNAGVSANAGGAKGQSVKVTTNANGEATVFFQGNQVGRVKLTAFTATTFRLIQETAQIMVR